MSIEGILFDSGDTLVFPSGGYWWPGPDFWHVLADYGFAPTASVDEAMEVALQVAGKVLELCPSAKDHEQEIDLFREYYRVLCTGLRIAHEAQMIDDLASAYVDGCNIELYHDTAATLKELAERGIVLGVLSDAWPSLNTKYQVLGIRDYFRSFTLSSTVGCYKPDSAMYRRAASDMGLDARSILFVDDDMDNVRGALRIGMQGVVILRNRNTDAGSIPTIAGLEGVFELLA